MFVLVAFFPFIIGDLDRDGDTLLFTGVLDLERNSPSSDPDRSRLLEYLLAGLLDLDTALLLRDVDLCLCLVLELSSLDWDMPHIRSSLSWIEPFSSDPDRLLRLATLLRDLVLDLDLDPLSPPRPTGTLFALSSFEASLPPPLLRPPRFLLFFLPFFFQVPEGDLVSDLVLDRSLLPLL